MAQVRRLERQATEIMEPLVDGTYAAAVIPQAHLWRCEGCGLVWSKKWHAETCESRGHKRSFDQGPYGVHYVENGRPVPYPGGQLTYYTRRAVRREAVRR